MHPMSSNITKNTQIPISTAILKLDKIYIANIITPTPSKAFYERIPLM